jgi:cyclophilin family peptidyl-prolyl cis-trans isomerase
MILLDSIEYFDKKYVAFGKVVQGWTSLDMIAQVSCSFEVPDLPIKVDDVRLI